MMQVLIDSGANVNVTNKAESSPLRMAIEADHLAVVKLLLKYKADTKMKYTNGRAILHYAIEKQNVGIVQALLDEGVEIDAKNEQGATPLILAAGGDINIIKALLSMRANVNAKTNSGWTPLMTAVNGQSISAVTLLIENGADVNAKDVDEWTALKQALLLGCKRIISILENNGAKE